ncbi:MAG: hypothetical protein PVG64_00225 [Syntrophobacterales bacterium]|jgi:4-amino-4-deoxy-L-arabinose transferase-like glycosyltransferase
MSPNNSALPATTTDFNEQTQIKIQSSALVGLIILLIAFGSLRLLWPGDVPFIDDEPRLLEMALQANETGESLPYGLKGTRNIRYGPFPVWIYRIMLMLTHDLVIIVILRVLLVTAITSISIVWLSMTCRYLWPLAGAAALLSPYLWFYSRSLWDNSFCIPLTALAFAAYLAFCRRKQWWTLAITFLCLTLLFLTHLMTLAVVVPILFHFLFFHRSWWKARWWIVLLFAGGGILLAWPYLVYLSNASPSGSPPGLGIKSWSFSLLGGRLFSMYGLDYFLGTSWANSPQMPAFVNVMVQILGRFTGIAIIFTWLGVLGSAVVVVTSLKNKDKRDIRFHACLISLAAICCQAILNVLSATQGQPHYYNGTWIHLFFFFWFAVSFAASRTWVKTLFGVYAVAMAAILIFLPIKLHLSAGNRIIRYGPTLANQIKVAKKLNQYHPKSVVETEVENVEKAPHAINFLQELYANASPSSGPQLRLLIRYARPERNNGMIELVELE